MSEKATPVYGPRRGQTLLSALSSSNSSTLSLLEVTELPSLTSTDSVENVQSSLLPDAKQSTSETMEFTMVSSDFPPLQATRSRRRGGSQMSSEKDSAGSSEVESDSKHSLNKKTPSKTGNMTYSDGRVTNIPASMLTDQFGMAGLLTFIGAAQNNPYLVSSGLGQDITTLGLDLNSPDNLYPTFGGPWARHPCRPQDIDFDVPPEYLTNTFIRDKLPRMRLSRYKDDLLFFMYYNNPNDALQMFAALELYDREWRFHMGVKMWLTKVPGMVMTEKTPDYEKGTYYFFNPSLWMKVPKEFCLEYNKIAEKPVVTASGLVR